MSLFVAVHLLIADPASLAAECTASRKGDEPAVAADVCRRAFEAVPGGPSDRHTLLLGTTHTLYMKALKENLDPALACADAEMLRTYEQQLAGLPASERPGDRASVQQALAEVTPLCASLRTKEPPAPPPPHVTYMPPPAPAEPTRTDRPRRPLRVVGGAVLGVGLGVGLATVGALIRGADLRAQAESTHTMHNAGAQIPVSGFSEYHGELARGQRANDLAIVFGVTAAALTVTGVTLLIADRRGKTRRIALSPRTLGLRLAMEF
jgi:hypothetical protein